MKIIFDTPEFPPDGGSWIVIEKKESHQERQERELSDRQKKSIAEIVKRLKRPPVIAPSDTQFDPDCDLE